MDNISIERIKRESINIISKSATALRTINLNRADANIDLFNMLVAQIAQAANELLLISNSIQKQESKNIF